jgi:hypothetical protein
MQLILAPGDYTRWLGVPLGVCLTDDTTECRSCAKTKRFRRTFQTAP